MFDPMKVAELKKLGFTDKDIEGLQAQAEATEKAADLMQIAYKAAADAGDVEIPPEVDDALLALYEQLGSDWDAVIAQLAAPQAELKRADPRFPPTGLVDQKKKAATVVVMKTYNATDDFFARALGADQVGRPAVEVRISEGPDLRPMHDRIADWAQQTHAAMTKR